MAVSYRQRLAQQAISPSRTDWHYPGRGPFLFLASAIRCLYIAVRTSRPGCVFRHYLGATSNVSPGTANARIWQRQSSFNGLRTRMRVTLLMLYISSCLQYGKCSKCEQTAIMARSRSMRCFLNKVQCKKWSIDEKKVKNMASGLDRAVCQMTLIVKFALGYHFTNCNL